MNKKGQLALIGILLAAILGAYTSSMTLVGAIVLSDVSLEDVEGFTVFAEQITITAKTGDLTSMAMAEGEINGMTVVAMNSSKVEITNMRLTKDTLEVTADRAVGVDVIMKVKMVVASNATFTDMTITAIPEFVQSVDGTATLRNVTITAVYMFAETMTMHGMELTIS